MSTPEKTPKTTPEAKIPEDVIPSPDIPKESSAGSPEIVCNSYCLANRGRFEKLGAWCQEKVASLYEKTGTAVERTWLGTATTEKGAGLMNSLEASFNDKLMKWHENRSLSVSQKLDNAKNARLGLEASKKSLDQALIDLSGYAKDGFSINTTEASLRRQIREVSDQMAKADTKINTFQSKLESRNNKMSTYANNRDRACENLKNSYEKKLAPREARVECLKKDTEALGFEIERARIQREYIQEQINEFQSKYSRFLKSKDLNTATAGFRMQLEEKDKRINAMAKEKNIIDKRLARTEDRANVYKDKADAIAHKTGSRPIKPEVGTRAARVDISDQREEVTTSDRRRAESTTAKKETSVKSEAGSETETGLEKEETKEYFSLATGIKKWNQHLRENAGSKSPVEGLIDLDSFRKSIGLDSFEGQSFQLFEKALAFYYRRGPAKKTVKSFENNIRSFERRFDNIDV